MKQKSLVACLGIALILAMLPGMVTARAEGPPWLKITGGPVVDVCTSVPFLIPVEVEVGTTGSDRGILTVPGAGVVFDFVENHSVYGPLSGPASYGVSPGAYAALPNSIFKFEITTFDAPNAGGEVTARSWIEFDCTTGVVTNSFFATAGYQAVPVPEGFLQYNIVCDSAVYDEPGGKAVGDNMVTAGQAWHINPEPVTGPDGQSWTEIFVAGVHTVYIPTSCIGGPTPFN
ncbi:MAG: hypothetical protein JW910_19835 [Anaerolineae bacterium]|nr:hypothetical protein [Anaerolineae bacterium]